MPQPAPVAPAPAGVVPQPSAGSREHVIVAGLPGTFYRSPLPGEAPFVEVGDLSRTTASWRSSRR